MSLFVARRQPDLIKQTTCGNAVSPRRRLSGSRTRRRAWLWSDSNIDLIDILDHRPISDWRDAPRMPPPPRVGPQSATAPFASEHGGPRRLRQVHCVRCRPRGADPDAEADGAYGRSSVFRPSDPRKWWSNAQSNGLGLLSAYPARWKPTTGCAGIPSAHEGRPARAGGGRAREELPSHRGRMPTGASEALCKVGRIKRLGQGCQCGAEP